MRNQAGFELTERHNVYSGYCRPNNYIAGVEKKTRIIVIPEIKCKNTIFLQRSMAAALLPHHVTTPAEAARIQAQIAEQRRELTDRIVAWTTTAVLFGSLVAARWI